MAAQKFSWAASADVLGGIAGAYGQWATVSSNKIIAKANAEAQNVIRAAQNQQRASALSLAATVRSIADDNTLRAAGQASNNSAELIARTQESWTRGNIEQGLKDMEQLGALTARASAAGVGGASVNAVSYSMRLQQARLAERTDEHNDEVQYELLKQRSGIMPAAASRLDLSPLAANLDYSLNTAPGGSDTASLTGALIEGLLSKKASLQVALDSIARDEPTYQGTGDFSRMDRQYSAIQIN